MYTQFLTPAVTCEELAFWEETVRLSWEAHLPELDIAHVWHMPDNGAISMYTLVFRTVGNNTHRHTNWFLIDPYIPAVQRYTEQHKMFMAVKPSAGTCDMLWKRRGTWYTMAEGTPYCFDIKPHRVVKGRFVNIAERRI